jgi:hypothetical protein
MAATRRIRHTLVMTVNRLGSAAAVVGGLLWIVAAALGWGEDPVSGTPYLAGLVLLVVAFAAWGYALVETAPVWLRAVVTVATPLLAVMVWLIVRDSIPAEPVAVLVGAALLLAGGVTGLVRGRGRTAVPATSGAPAADPPPARGRRAAR